MSTASAGIYLPIALFYQVRPTGPMTSPRRRLHNAGLSGALSATVAHRHLLPGNPHPMWLQGVDNDRLMMADAAAVYILCFRILPCFLGGGMARWRQADRPWGTTPDLPAFGCLFGNQPCCDDMGVRRPLRTSSSAQSRGIRPSSFMPRNRPRHRPNWRHGAVLYQFPGGALRSKEGPPNLPSCGGGGLRVRQASEYSNYLNTSTFEHFVCTV